MMHWPSHPRLANALAAPLAILFLLLAVSRGAEPAGGEAERVAVRCAVIGGMSDTGVWQAVCNRFRAATGIEVDVVASGPKQEIVEPFRRGEADLITMHASDTIINLVADGVGRDPQPWARSDLVLVGPRQDPAGIKGSSDAVAALRKIIETKSKLLIHQSLGSSEVLHGLLDEGRLDLDSETTIVLPSDRHRQMLQRAARENAYTLVGRIPFLNGKIPNDQLEIMVQGDPRMRRPYLVVVSNLFAPESVRGKAARRLAEFLREEETQRWLAEFGRGKLDQQPLFYPVLVSSPGDSRAAKP
jgi:tungstate transport system substrate-binding protein